MSISDELLVQLLSGAGKAKKSYDAVWASLCLISVIILVAVATYAYTGGALPTLPSFAAPAVQTVQPYVATPQPAALPQTAPRRVQAVPTVVVARPVDVPAVQAPVVPQAPVATPLPGRADEAVVQVAPVAAEGAAGQAVGAGAWIK